MNGLISWVTSVDNRIGVYWMVSAALFLWLTYLAARRFAEEPTKMHVSILAFALYWGTLCAHNAIYRFGFISESSLSSWEAEAIRALCAVSIAWLCWEFRSRQPDRRTEE